MKPISLIALFLFALNIPVKAQGSGTITVSIITPITISKTFNSFSGTLALASVTTTSNTTKNYKRSIRSATKAPASIDIPAANFTLSGMPSYTYSISLPSAPLTITNGTSTLTIEDFSLRNNSSTPDESGFAVDQDITIMAKVRLSATPAAGRYIAPLPVNIIVNYN